MSPEETLVRQLDAVRAELSTAHKLINDRDKCIAADRAVVASARTAVAKLAAVELELAVERRLTQEYRKLLLDLCRSYTLARETE